jgi:uncharacterized membrane protein
MIDQWFDNNRIAGISDGVFAIAMTLLVLELRLPELEEPVSAQVFRDALIHQLPQFVSWIISFAILCRLWIAQHALIQLYDKKSRVFTAVNFAFLGAISFIPFPTSLISEHPDQPLSVIIFSLTILVAWGAMVGMGKCQKDIETHSSDYDSLLNSIRPVIVLIPIVVVASFVLSIIDPRFGVWIWVLLPVAGRLVKRRRITQ